MRRHKGTAGGPLHIHVSEPRKPASEVDYGEPLNWPADPAARPYLDQKGNLVIPMKAPHKWRWWQGGQTVAQTLKEVMGEERWRS